MEAGNGACPSSSSRVWRSSSLVSDGAGGGNWGRGGPEDAPLWDESRMQWGLVRDRQDVAEGAIPLPCHPLHASLDPG